jgi:hypothetical protein
MMAMSGVSRNRHGVYCVRKGAEVVVGLVKRPVKTVDWLERGRGERQGRAALHRVG